MNSEPAPPGWSTPIRRLARERLLLTLLALVMVLAIADPRAASDYLHWLDVPTLAGLCGLLVLTTAIVASGALQRLALRLALRLHSVRALAFTLALLAAALSTVLTNDVALFLVVPLTLALARIAPVPRQRLVIFEALAVNAGSTFSPIGNPQNLLLWQRSGRGFFDYVAALAPTGAVLLGVLLIACFLAFPARPLKLDPRAAALPRLAAPLFAGALALLAAMVAALQLGHALPAAGVVLLLGLAYFPRVLAQVDWPLLLTFAAMFVGLGHLAALPFVQSHVGALDWTDPRMTLAGGIVLSQLISNVPAAVLLQHFAPDTTLLAAAVNVGGAGLLIGSLANLIALRLDGSRGIAWRFHAYSLPYLAVTAVLVALVLLR